PEELRAAPLVLVSADLRPGLSACRELPALLEERGLPWRDVRVALELPTDLAVLASLEAGGGVGLVSRLLLEPGYRPRFRLAGGTLVLIVPSRRPLSTSCSLSFTTCGTLASRSWKGARPVSPKLLPACHLLSLRFWMSLATPGVNSFSALETSAGCAAGTVRY